MNNRALSISNSFISFGVFCIVLMAGHFFFSIIDPSTENAVWGMYRFLFSAAAFAVASGLAMFGAYSMLNTLRKRSLVRQEAQKILQERLVISVISAGIGGFSTAFASAYATSTPNILWVLWGIAAAFTLNAGWVIYQIATEKARY